MNNNLFVQWADQTPQIRKNILQMIAKAQSGHPGGSLSCVEIIYTLMAPNGVMKYNPKKPLERERDRFVLSKGHACPTLYAVLSAVGHDISQDELMSLRQLGSRLQGHPDRARLPYVEASTGSLGQGASIAQGIAMSYKLDSLNHRVFALLGDGEMQEGQIWEVALSAPHQKLDNLTLILDYNKGQIDGPTNKVLSLDPLTDKWRSFGWEVSEVNGHSYSELYTALSKKSPRPQMVIAHTIKGRGVSFMEGNTDWHGRAPNVKELELALQEVAANRQIGLSN
ncbi:MAG: transketolase [Bdellovibrionales bacterium RIFOXYD12_FULL_39_22]|nr:MAG: transketolase [Bdellovibrionales bacterium RIFOXYB1_FULL_39_21]OFZ43572.1 MAG: transketolase [Bdellovibrionales bacterium RIFOXYC12_FULL_39_17]OFZ44591.1 MAG: transketolase [Bdellovibrionales bacterium RIFOXYC1_FULL_39_130]OFZ72981.1 MAG: transketolase [Bdellovibrionales bacterium RIFOXYC2_FULL_39_8]OFZ76350.1 MAG: transketolase [Bdellovibrionales bacterium RIFOXYD1_FULL_39_84]OFZ94616.1 MAG: transketolase [Bdellovibrionales bacterium RIFOXYD12_FULL_39_22]HLE12929.1 transketolase [Bac